MLAATLDPRLIVQSRTCSLPFEVEGTFCFCWASVLLMIVACIVLAPNLAEVREHRLFVEGKPTWYKLQPGLREEVVDVKKFGKLIVGTIEQDFSGAYSGTNKFTFIKDRGKVHVSDAGPPYKVVGNAVVVAPYSPFPCVIGYSGSVIYRAGKFTHVSIATGLSGFDGKTVTGWFCCDSKGKPLMCIEFGETYEAYGQAFKWTDGKRKLLERVRLRQSSNTYVWP